MHDIQLLFVLIGVLWCLLLGSVGIVVHYDYHGDSHRYDMWTMLQAALYGITLGTLHGDGTTSVVP